MHLSGGIIAQPFNSNKLRLNDGWEFLKSDLGGIWESVRPVVAGNPEALPIWSNVTLPHCFNSTDAVDPDVNYYQGPGWYRQSLEITNPYPNGRTVLHFEGAGQKTDVYVYTTKVGSHTGGYDEWSVDITDAVNEFKKTSICEEQFNGKIPVSIRCDNSRDLEMIPSNLSDFNIYGGIYRYLNLEYFPSLNIENLFVNASTDPSGKSGIISIDADFINIEGAKQASLQLQLLDPNGKVIKQITSSLTEFKQNLNLLRTSINKPQLWSPSQPSLYTCKTKLISDSGEQTLIEKFGFRNFQFIDSGPFLLNGKRLLLRGTHRHEDHAGVGAAMTEEMMREEMILMKEMGVNFIRLGHYQQSRIILNLCDSLGILVWEEIPWCRGGLGGTIYKEQSRRMLTNMIQQHRNHPSVIIWGLGNENDWPGDFPVFSETDIRLFMEELNNLAHSLDPTRKTAIRRSDFAKDIVDVYSPSIWAGWYRGQYLEYRTESEKEMKTVKNFFHAEYGGDSHALRHSENPDKVIETVALGTGADERQGDASLYGGAERVSRDGDWSETYICNLFDWHLKEQENMPWLTGAAFWIFKDFSTPIRPENPIPYMNQKGVVERDLTKKESYYVFQSYWTESPMVHIYGHTWPVRWGAKNEDKLVKVYSNCTEAELFLNGKSMGVKKRNSQDFPAAGLRWIVKFNEGENNLKVVARMGNKTVTDEIIQQYQTDEWEEPAKLVIEKIAQEGEIVTLQVKLLDKNNVQCLDAKNYIRFSISGDGSLIEDMGTSTGSSYVQAYNGRVIIKAKTNNGKSTVGVQSDKLETVFLEL